MEQAETNREYFRRRAEQERLAEARAANLRAAQSHRGLAERFEALATAGTRPIWPDQASATLTSELRIVP